MEPSTSQGKTRLLLGFISQDLADSMSAIAKASGMSMECLHLSHQLKEFLKEATKVDAVFVQWDGRANTSHEIIGNWAQGPSAPKGPIYAVTTSKIRVETLSTKPSRLLNIAGWFDIPVETERLKTELALLVPDKYDDFTSELVQSGLKMLAELPLPRLRGKHLIDEIKTAWDERFQTHENTTRSKETILKNHIALFSTDQARTHELSKFLTEIRFKHHKSFDDVAETLLFMRGHGTDALLLWFDGSNKDVEYLLKSHLEHRNSRRIPIVVVVASQELIKPLQERCAEVFIDKVIVFDRNRERFRLALIEGIESLTQDHSQRKLLEDLRSSAKDSLTASSTQPMDIISLEVACIQLSTDPAKIYWADAEKLLGYARLKDEKKFSRQIQVFASKYQHFDAKLNIASARCQFMKEETEVAAHAFAAQLSEVDDLDADRLFRAGTFFVRVQYMHGLHTVLDLWWDSRTRWAPDHQFAFLASRYCHQKHLFALERALLAMAVRQDPLRADYVEAYCQHLAMTGHHGHAIKLCEFLATSDFFSKKRALQILIQSHLKLKNSAAALAGIDELLKQQPADKQLLSLQAKLQGTP